MFKKSVVCVVCVLMILAMLVSACSKKSSPSVVGKWHTEESGGMDWEFTKDGKISITLMGQTLEAGTYTVSGDKIKLEISLMGQSETQEVTYKIDGDKLSMDDGTSKIEFTKVK